MTALFHNFLVPINQFSVMRLLHYFFVLCPVPNVACVSELSVLDCPFGFLPPLLPCTYYIEVFVPSQENRRSCIYICCVYVLGISS